MDKNGRRCTERQGLEFHHGEPYGRGGDHRPENVYLICRAHNRYLAEQDYGKEVMERYRRSGSRVSEPSPTYLYERGRYASPSGRSSRTGEKKYPYKLGQLAGSRVMDQLPPSTGARHSSS